MCFKIGPPRLVGVEVEWFVHDDRCPTEPVPPERTRAALRSLPLGGEDGTSLPSGSRLTLEPGGQVELSSRPATGLLACVEDTRRDLTALRAAFAAQGLRLTGTGTDPLARPRRMVLDHPRYLAMERHFDSAGPWGRIMMTGTASLQVCLDAGDADGPHAADRRWLLAHRLGPVLVAAFANSPLLDGKPTGHRSTRQIVWSRMDPTRTLAPAPDHGDPREAWAQYVLDAEVLCVRRPDGIPWTAPRGLTFRDWLRGAGERPPTLADLDYHRTTLFPPVRPRGHLELRMIDAQPGDGWVVPAALVTALLDDPVAADAALAALEPLEALEAPRTPGPQQGADSPRAPRSDVWRRAATLAVADPELRRAALACFAAADAALGRLPGAGRLRATVAGFAERYPARGRCPADDQLDALRAGTRRTPPEEAAP
ncbi:ergothioneine biosynthesis glutamate--cysteine ligase EgtA [Streptomyces sp. SP17BM10]|uniref:ergothioneine biosynthesis glutamate--cysteine ligase EgtA n=1 Tax=Streptomyces sp. SP17BM10 TaxID=3002530 RepID=UPI002E7A6823|nr:ergothioneine biosynthesis glutamate--cysteine ligase EgtA [Streptomyces sp. SP17BM10]MEE1787374.1 ergothioneine biosynthesis glutamate--cysteine ligase EgtA [Streptomyces sp. SP17BM10]